MSRIVAVVLEDEGEKNNTPNFCENENENENT